MGRNKHDKNKPNSDGFFLGTAGVDPDTQLTGVELPIEPWGEGMITHTEILGTAALYGMEATIDDFSDRHDSGL